MEKKVAQRIHAIGVAPLYLTGASLLIVFLGREKLGWFRAVDEEACVKGFQFAFVLLIVAGALSRRTVPRGRLFDFMVVLTAFVGLISTSAFVIRDGAYPCAEFHVFFRGPSGQPIEGVELQVEDREGNTFYHYPVSDFLPDHIPKSDRDGRLVFHHAGLSLEFSDRCWYLFFLFPMGEQSRPHFLCRFLHAGHEVYRMSYEDMYAGQAGKVVSRRWRWTRWPYSVFLTFSNKDERARNSSFRSFFDNNKDGWFSPEEKAAYGAANTAVSKTIDAMSQKLSEEQEMEFELLSREVRIPRQRPRAKKGQVQLSPGVASCAGS
jgi:hypothetical protein